MYRVIAVIITLFVASAASAQEFKVDFGISSSDPDAPIEVEANSLSIDQETGNATFEGDVIITQGDMRFAAPLVEVTYNSARDGIAKLAGTGGVEILSGQDSARSENAEYDVDTGLIFMQGSVALAQGANTITAERMTVNTLNSTAELHGRVRTVLNAGGNQ